VDVEVRSALTGAMLFQHSRLYPHGTCSLDACLRRRLEEKHLHYGPIRFFEGGAPLERVRNVKAVMRLTAVLVPLLTEEQVDEALRLLSTKKKVTKHNVFEVIGIDMNQPLPGYAQVAKVLSANRRVAEAVISQRNVPHYRHLHVVLRQDKELFLRALDNVHNQAAAPLQWAGPHLAKDRDVATKAARCKGNWPYIGLELRADRSFMQPHVEKDGLLLQYASQALRGDAALVNIACRQNPDALGFASQSAQPPAEEDGREPATKKTRTGASHAASAP
jgi:hypothetical protein